MKKLSLFLALLSFLAAAEPPGREKINRLAAPEACLEALAKDTDRTVRRVAFRKLIYSEDTFQQAVKIGLADRDPGIRSLALYELFHRDGDKAVPLLKRMLKDPAPEVGRMLAELGRSIQNQKEKKRFLAELAGTSPFPEIRRTASRGMGFPFYRENRPLSQDPTYDHELLNVSRIRLPLSSWAFRTDPGEIGHLEKPAWFSPAFRDAEWKRIGVTKSWEKQGVPGYDGIAWYRVEFQMPRKPECTTVELCFQGVDEAAWVWLNGKFIGQHDIGPDGWDVPFRFNVAEEILWGGKNQLTVRVEDTEMDGGIWKPVVIEVLK